MGRTARRERRIQGEPLRRKVGQVSRDDTTSRKATGFKNEGEARLSEGVERKSLKKIFKENGEGRFATGTHHLKKRGKRKRRGGGSLTARGPSGPGKGPNIYEGRDNKRDYPIISSMGPKVRGPGKAAGGKVATQTGTACPA